MYVKTKKGRKYYISYLNINYLFTIVLIAILIT